MVGTGFLAEQGAEAQVCATRLNPVARASLCTPGAQGRQTESPALL